MMCASTLTVLPSVDRKSVDLAQAKSANGMTNALDVYLFLCADC